jgi:hypothetical protein
MYLPPRDPVPEPSWGRVLAVTVALWASRRFGRDRRARTVAYYGAADTRSLRRSRVRWSLVVFVLLLVILALAGLQLSGALSSNTTSPSTSLLFRIALLIAATSLAGAFSTFALPYLRRARGRHRMRRLTWVSVRSLTGLAAFIAGREGLALHGESDDHLAGNSGHDPVTWATVIEAAKWVVTGVRYRGQDWAEAAWKPAEAVLRSRALSSLFVSVPTIAVAVEVLIHKGTMTLFTSFGSIFATGAFLSGMIKAGRKYRGAEPPEPKPRQAKK